MLERRAAREARLLLERVECREIVERRMLEKRRRLVLESVETRTIVKLVNCRDIVGRRVHVERQGRVLVESRDTVGTRALVKRRVLVILVKRRDTVERRAQRAGRAPVGKRAPTLATTGALFA